MWFYYLFLFLIGVNLYIYEKEQIPLARYSILIIVILVAICRYQIGYDYETYYTIIKNEDSILVDALFSPLSKLFAEIAIYFHAPQLLFVLFGIPTYILIFSTLKRYSFNYSLSVIIFICSQYYSSLSIIRQALAVAIIFYGYKYVINRNFIKYLLCVAIAALVHPSAIVAIVIYWLHIINFSVVIVGLLLFFFVKSIVFNLMMEYNFYSSYLENRTDLEGGTLTRIFKLLLSSVTIFLWKMNGKQMLINRGLVNIVVTGIFMYFIFGAHIGGRVAFYFDVFLCLLIPNVLASLTSIKMKKYLNVVFIYIYVLYYILYLWIPFIKGVPSEYVPYKVFFLQ